VIPPIFASSILLFPATIAGFSASAEGASPLLESIVRYIAHGTPLYIYNGDLVIQRYKELHDFIKWPKLKIYYAMKANYNVAILRLLKEKGAYLDTVSPAEVHLALNVGFDPNKLLYTANNMTDEEVKEVHKLGILFNIDSLSRLQKYGKSLHPAVPQLKGQKVILLSGPEVFACRSTRQLA